MLHGVQSEAEGTFLREYEYSLESVLSVGARQLCEKVEKARREAAAAA